MAKERTRERFAYDFERPVCEIEKQIDELQEKAESGEDLGAQIEELTKERDRVLREISEGLSAYQRVKLARHPLRPQSLDYVRMIFEDFAELHGDRRFGDDKAILTALGRIQGRKLLLIAQQKGKDTAEKMKRNFGMPEPEGYRKAWLKMRLAAKFHLPIVCLIDTPGASPTVAAEERGQAMAIAENIFEMAGIRTPIIVLVIGEGCSGGALGMGVGDRFAMLENAYYSVISPEGCAAILWRDGEKAAEAAEAMKLTAADMLRLGIISEVLEEPLGGAHRDPEAAARTVEQYLVRTLDELSAIPLDSLVEERYARYRALGVYEA